MELLSVEIRATIASLTHVRRTRPRQLPLPAAAAQRMCLRVQMEATLVEIRTTIVSLPHVRPRIRQQFLRRTTKFLLRLKVTIV